MKQLLWSVSVDVILWNQTDLVAAHRRKDLEKDALQVSTIFPGWKQSQKFRFGDASATIEWKSGILIMRYVAQSLEVVTSVVSVQNWIPLGRQRHKADMAQ